MTTLLSSFLYRFQNSENRDSFICLPVVFVLAAWQHWVAAFGKVANHSYVSPSSTPSLFVRDLQHTSWRKYRKRNITVIMTVKKYIMKKKLSLY